ncbi:MAG TPA: hypothetical protein VFR29_06415 [Steroidobacteraceae bacterium]|nr:hypothetical protein [Steroidobacteraceae bacterium]
MVCNPCKQIAFTSSRDGNYEIYSVNADGTGLARLTDNDSYDGEPAWSPDGQRIAFVSGRDFDASGNLGVGSELYVMDTDGSNVERLTFSRSRAGRPTWSPDGTRIAYESFSDGSANLWEVPAGGGTPTLLFSSPGFDGLPAWSPDGTRLALVSDWFAYDIVTDVFLINADGSGFTAVTDGNIFDQVNYEDPAWSPDGGRLAMTVSTRLGTFDYLTQIGLGGANGSDLALLPTLAGTTLDGVSVGTPSWSPDGTMVAYTSCSDGMCHVVWIKADGSARGEIIRNGWDPDWQR